MRVLLIALTPIIVSASSTGEEVAFVLIITLTILVLTLICILYVLAKYREWVRIKDARIAQDVGEASTNEISAVSIGRSITLNE
jgi:hypothetical protein